MKVAILGIGGVGRVLTQLLRADPAVDSLALVDKVEARARFFADFGGRVRIGARAFNLEHPADLPRVLQGCQVVVNTAPPKYNLAVMRACVAAGASYLDLAAAGPRGPGAPPGILEQLQLHETFRARGLRALVSMGLDPGMSNVLARDSADALDSIDAVRIRSGGTAKIPGYAIDTLPLYSRETFLADILVPPSVWLDGRLEERPALGEPEDFEFPSPVGVQPTYLCSHEEVKTLPKYLGKPVRSVDFRQAHDPRLILAILALDRLGLFADEHTVAVGGQLVPFRNVFLGALPEPSALTRPVEGAKALSVEVEGTSHGTKRIERRDIVMDHRESSRRAALTAVIYLSASAAAIGTVLLGSKGALEPGVHPSESLDPNVVLREWSARGLPFIRSQRAVS